MALPNQTAMNGAGDYPYYGVRDNKYGGVPGCYQLERSILDPCQHPIYLKPSDHPCSYFFQQRGPIDLKSYIRLKQEERLAVVQYHAAVRIQALWRGFMIRSNWKIVEAAATKIESWIRAHMTRKKFRQILEERDAKVRLGLLEEVAVKIQTAWRGYISRKNKLDFKKYKSIQQKNEALRRSIALINELESALLKTLQCSHRDSRSSSAEPTFSEKTNDSLNACAELAKTDNRLSFFLNNIISPSVENFLVEKIPEYVDELSEGRIVELYAYLANMESEMKQERELEQLVKKLGGLHMLSEQQQVRLEESRRTQKERAQHILDLAKLVTMEPLKKKLETDKQHKAEMEVVGEGDMGKDPVDDMFPPLPQRPDVVQPDRGKVEALKDAIRIIRQQGKAKQDRDLKKKHPLLRTKTCPGVFSDIYTTELTEMERKLKALKFWKGSLAQETLARKEALAKENRLKGQFTHALKISNKRRDTEEYDEEEDITVEEGIPLDLYEKFAEEIESEDDDDYDEDCSYTTGGSRRGSFYEAEQDPKPPPPTPTLMANAD